MRECEICGEWGVSVYLAGHFPAYLCLKHEREWNEYCHEAPAFGELLFHGAEVEGLLGSVRGGHGTVRDVVRGYQSHQDAKIQMYHTAKAWLENKVDTAVEAPTLEKGEGGDSE